MKLREALRKIAEWELPPTGDTWPGGGPVSYGAKHGSNGERDYMRELARAALAEPVADEPVAVKRHDPHCHMVGPNDGGREWIEELAPIAIGTKLYTSPAAQEPASEISRRETELAERAYQHAIDTKPVPVDSAERGEYPPLPNAVFKTLSHDLFTADQMRAHVDADRAQRVPLTDERVRDAFMTTNTRTVDQNFSAFCDGVRFAERAHGIGAKP